MKLYEVCEDEDNPFFSVRENEMKIEDLVENRKRAEEHWRCRILNKF